MKYTVLKPINWLVPETGPAIRLYKRKGEIKETITASALTTLALDPKKRVFEVTKQAVNYLEACRKNSTIQRRRRKNV
ncbi:MAG: hypothetical protein ACXACW_14730 [Candidatus Hodarchaeales archaeon]|jgi:hypothetical protein